MCNIQKGHLEPLGKWILPHLLPCSTAGLVGGPCCYRSLRPLNTKSVRDRRLTGDSMEEFNDDNGLTCASNATPLVISSNAAVDSGEKRSSPDEGKVHKRSQKETRNRKAAF